MMLKDISHDHQLKLQRLDPKASIKNCSACLQGIVDKLYYNCTQPECNYSLHEFCGELPLVMDHGLHQLHPLKLKLSKEDENYFCDSCLKFSKCYFYKCDICSFKIDIICATAARRMLHHNGHKHPLTLQRRESTSYCNACDREHKGIFYQCHTCVVFSIHQDCAALGDSFDSKSHPHPLRLVYHRQEFETIVCDVCDKKIESRRGWYSDCIPCEFYAHLTCAMSEQVREEEEIDPEIPQFPLENVDGEFGLIGLLNSKSGNEDEDDDNEGDSTIDHFSHPKHPLVFQASVTTEKNPYTGDQIPLAAKCNGCARKISAPLYSCSECAFFLHKSCALIPSSVEKHPLHSHSRLVLSRESWSDSSIFQCDSCRETCNGFCFRCEDESCNFEMDLECAFLPTNIVHKAHPFHLLTLSDDTDDVVTKMKCCVFDGHFMGVYECNNCSFKIHANCAMYPAKTNHRYDQECPFKLWYDRGPVEPNEYYCEICEKYLDPKAWFYHSHSRIGDQLIHPLCILQSEHKAFRKFKSTDSLLRGDIHPHRLHLSPTYVFQRCDHCLEVVELEHDMDDPECLGYICLEDDCYFQLHIKCARKMGPDDTADVINFLTSQN